MLEVPVSSSRRQLHEIVVNAFPQLKDTGYDFCRGSAGGTKRLENLGTISKAAVLKSALGQAKCYLRPIAHDLKIDSPKPKKQSDLVGNRFLCDNIYM